MSLSLAIKWVFDRAAAAVGLVVLVPAMGAIAVFVVASMGRPVLFCQRRPGLHGRGFTLYKFRTMVPSVAGLSESEVTASDAGRITALGAALRRFSLDEIPQLWNVLVGDMSLVGPRPLLMSYLQRYTKTQQRRHDVRPGITGLAQISGRNGILWEERFAHDVDYVDRWSLYLDVTILVRTVGLVLRSEGVSLEGGSKMPEFVGVSDTGSNPGTIKDGARSSPEGEERDDRGLGGRG